MIKEFDLEDFNLKFLIHLFKNDHYLDYSIEELHFKISNLSSVQFIYLINKISIQEKHLKYLMNVDYVRNGNNEIKFIDFLCERTDVFKVLKKYGSFLSNTERLTFYIYEWNKLVELKDSIGKSEILSNSDALFSNIQAFQEDEIRQIFKCETKNGDKVKIPFNQLIPVFQWVLYSDFEKQVSTGIFEFIDNECTQSLTVDIVTNLKWDTLLPCNLQVVFPLIFSYESYLNYVAFHLLKTNSKDEFDSLKDYFINGIKELESRIGSRCLSYQSQLLGNDESIWIGEIELYQDFETANLTMTEIKKDLNEIFVSKNQLENKKYVSDLIHNHIFKKDSIVLSISPLKFSRVIDCFLEKHGISVEEEYLIYFTESISSYDKKYHDFERRSINHFNLKLKQYFDRGMLIKFIHLLLFLEHDGILSFNGRSSLERLFRKEFSYLNIPDKFIYNKVSTLSKTMHLKRSGMLKRELYSIL